MVTYSNPGPLEFEAVIQRADVTGSSAFVAMPFDVPEKFGSKGRVPVSATFDGIPYRGSIVSWGGPPLLLVLTSIQQQLGKGPGDSLRVHLELDTATRVVDLDADIESRWADAGVLDNYRAMAYSHQREYSLWITEAKRPETRERRIDKAAEMLREGKRLK